MMLNHMITNTMKVLYFDVDPYEHYVVEEETAGQNSRQVAKKIPKSKSLVNYEES